MRAAAQSGVSAAVAKSPDVDLIYVPPLGDWKAFEAALSSLARRFIGRVRMVRASSARLCRFTSARLFLSTAVPNIVVLRGGEVFAHTVGALPMTELKGILDDATRCAF
jgi:hypothetical protein